MSQKDESFAVYVCEDMNFFAHFDVVWPKSVQIFCMRYMLALFIQLQHVARSWKLIIACEIPMCVVWQVCVGRDEANAIQWAVQKFGTAFWRGHGQICDAHE